MSFQLIGDLMVHFNKLENLDCFTYGKYRIKLKILRNSNTNITNDQMDREYIIPYLIPTKPYDSKEPLNKSDQAQIDQFNTFYSTSFMIKNTNQEIDMNEMCIFKFDEKKQKKMSDYMVEISIWRYIGSLNINQKVTLDSYGYEEIFMRKFKIISLGRNISQFIPVFFAPHRTALLHYKYFGYDEQNQAIPFIEFLKKLTKNFNKNEVSKINYLLNKSLLNTLKEIIDKCKELQDNYFQFRFKYLKQQLGSKFIEKEANNRHQIFTTRDQYLNDSFQKFKKNMNIKIFREIKTLNKEEEENHSKEIEFLMSEYEKFDFFDLEQRKILASAELFDYTEIFKKNQEGLESLIFTVNQQVNKYKIISYYIFIVFFLRTKFYTEQILNKILKIKIRSFL